MRKSPVLLLGLALVLFSISDTVRSQAFDPPADQAPLARISYDGKKPSGLTYGDVSLTVDSAPVAGGPERVPVVTGRYKGQGAFTIRLDDDAAQEEPAATVSLMKIDPSTPAPQVVLSYFTLGAHCCTMTRIATVDAGGQWRVVDAGALDGEGYEFKDLDGDGGSQLISVDNSFLYAFGCYACSVAPPQIHKLIGPALTDVTREVRYQPFLKYQIRQMEQAATQDGQWGSNGFLGGWVATKALVGELSDAWRTMLERYDRQPDWNMDECVTGAELDKCPPDQVLKLNFPAALAKHLLAHGYITADERRQLRVPN
jgi:hypothetical protein